MFKIESIQLNKALQQPLYLQLSEVIKEKIKRGEGESGEKLPSIRKMANGLGVNSVTIVNAYKLLSQEGIITSKGGSGYYIGRGEDNFSASPVKLSINDDIYEEEDINLMSRGQVVLSSRSINFASATPSPELFPVEDFKSVLNEVLDRDKGEAFGYQESSGYRPLREAIGVFIRENYDIRAGEEEIQIISGAQQGIDVIGKALINNGDFVFVENPTYTGATAVFKSRGANIVGIPIHKDGIDIDVLERSIKLYRPKLIYVMPNYQNPTTYSYSEEKKKYLLEMSLQYNFYIVEDDSLSGLNYCADKDRSTLKAMDRYKKVIYIKSFSKVLMPGLRIGFLIVPQDIYHDVLQAKHTTDISSSGLIQRAFDLYLRRGIWEKRLDYMREVYGKRYNKIISEVCGLIGEGAELHKPDGGLNLWITLPKNISGIQLYHECAKKDVLFVPGKIFYVGQRESCDRNIRLSFAAVNSLQIETGMQVIYKEIKNVLEENNVKGLYFGPLV